MEESTEELKLIIEECTNLKLAKLKQSKTLLHLYSEDNTVCSYNKIEIILLLNKRKTNG